MNALINYLKRTGSRRFVMMVAGNVFAGMGISIFKLSRLGNDPFSGMTMALSACTGIPYARFQVLFNLVLLAVEIALGREYIGAGTVVNAVLLGYFVTFFNYVWMGLGIVPAVFWQQLVTVFIGMIICSFGLSLYQTSDVGIAPYDSLALIMHKRLPRFSYFWHRMFWDALSAVVCFTAGGIVGIGTLVTAFGFGPFIHFFNVHAANRMIRKQPDKNGNSSQSVSENGI